MGLIGNQFDFDERAEVDGCDGFGKLDDVRGADAELLVNGLSVAKQSDPQRFPVVHLKD